MEVTSYFERNVLNNLDRLDTTKEMCEAVVRNPESSDRHPDGRFRYWGRPAGRRTHLLVVVTADGTALHNAFFDSNFTRRQRRREREG